MPYRRSMADEANAHTIGALEFRELGLETIALRIAILLAKKGADRKPMDRVLFLFAYWATRLIFLFGCGLAAGIMAQALIDKRAVDAFPAGVLVGLLCFAFRRFTRPGDRRLSFPNRDDTNT